MSTDPNRCFQLRVRIPGNGATQPAPVCTITAYDHNWSLADSHGRIDVEVRHDGAVVFPLGQLYCAVSKACGHSSDGKAARELVMSLVAMRPSARGGEGEDYYAGYTPEQLAWVEAHGEDIDMERERRYCDENGEVK